MCVVRRVSARVDESERRQRAAQARRSRRHLPQIPDRSERNQTRSLTSIKFPSTKPALTTVQGYHPTLPGTKTNQGTLVPSSPPALNNDDDDAPGSADKRKTRKRMENAIRAKVRERVAGGRERRVEGRVEAEGMAAGRWGASTGGDGTRTVKVKVTCSPTRAAMRTKSR